MTWSYKEQQSEDETKEISSGIHHPKDGIHTYTRDEDDEGPRPAKRQWKLRSEPIEEALPPLHDHGINPAAPPTELQLAVQAIDDNQDWEVRKIIGKEDVDGVRHYLVDWSPTLVPEHWLGHAKELVDGFEARLLAQRNSFSITALSACRSGIYKPIWRISFASSTSTIAFHVILFV